jgi:Flp pilus assembly protein TadG
MVEFAITLPVLLVLALGTVEVGRAFSYDEAVVNGARQALRLAVNPTQQGTGDTACSSSGNNPVTVSSPLPPSAGSPIFTIANAAALESSTTGSSSGSALSGGTLSVTWHCVSSRAVTNSTNAGVTNPTSSASDSITAQITYNLRMLTPFANQISASGRIAITATAVGRAEY